MLFVYGAVAELRSDGTYFEAGIAELRHFLFFGWISRAVAAEIIKDDTPQCIAGTKSFQTSPGAAPVLTDKAWISRSPSYSIGTKKTRSSSVSHAKNS